MRRLQREERRIIGVRGLRRKLLCQRGWRGDVYKRAVSRVLEHDVKKRKIVDFWAYSLEICYGGCGQEGGDVSVF